MSRKCHVCDKKVLVGRNVSHANNKTRKVSQPNLQRIRIKEKGSVQRAYVCTRCIRSGAVQKAV